MPIIHTFHVGAKRQEKPHHTALVYIVRLLIETHLSHSLTRKEKEELRERTIKFN